MCEALRHVATLVAPRVGHIGKHHPTTMYTLIQTEHAQASYSDLAVSELIVKKPPKIAVAPSSSSKQTLRVLHHPLTCTSGSTIIAMGTCSDMPTVATVGPTSRTARDHR